MYTTKITGKVTVLGDTHGEYETTKVLLTYLAKQKDFEDRWIVFLGDYVDGPDTNNLTRQKKKCMDRR